MEKKDIEEEFIRPKKASKFSSFSVSHINLLIKEKKIKSYLPSPKVRLIEVKSLIDYIKNNEEVQNDN